jgi:predicted RNase H-like HicB family nuclease
MTTREFTAVYEYTEGWWTAWVEELGGAFGQGRTRDECRDSLKEAIVLILEAQREIAEMTGASNLLRENLEIQVA